MVMDYVKGQTLSDYNGALAQGDVRLGLDDYLFAVTSGHDHARKKARVLR